MSFSTRLLRAAILSGGASGALGQELPTPFFEMRTGEVSPIGGVVGDLFDPTFNRQEEEIVVGWDATNQQGFVTYDGLPLYLGRETELLPGLTWRGFGGVGGWVGPDGARWTAVQLYDSSNNFAGTGLFHGRTPVIVPRMGQPVMAPGAPPGLLYHSLNGELSIVGVFDSGCYVGVSVATNPTGAFAQVALVEVRVDSSGRLVSERIMAMDGWPLPGLNGIVNRVIGGTFRGCGASAILVVEQGGQGGRVAVINGTTTVRAGDPSPYPGRNWGFIGGVTSNCNGDWVVAGSLDDGKRVLVKNGEQFIHEDEIDPEVSGGGVLELSALGWRSLSSRGRLTWAAVFHVPGGGGAVWSFFTEQRLIGTSGRIYDDGKSSALWLPPNIEDDGVNAGAIVARFEPGVGFVTKALGIRLDQADPVCTNGPTSLGEDPIVSVHGSPWLADETEFEIMTRMLPPGAFALTVAGDAPGSTVNPAGSIGELCIAGAPLRSIPLRANVRGVTRAWLHEFPGILSNAPDPGETWRFQTWYRDFDLSTSTPVSRWTEAVELMFR